MSFLSKFLNRSDPREAMLPLYNAVVAEARRVHWYSAGGVPDTREGRFEMVAALLSLTLLGLERDEAQTQNSVFLTELFVEDMDGQLRQFGIGDMIVGKHIGKLMSALGGRLGAYRAALDGSDAWDAVVTRNIWGGEEAPEEQRAHVVAGLKAYATSLGAMDMAQLVAGHVPDTQAAQDKEQPA